MTQAVRHSGTAREAFGLSIRGQLVDFAQGQRVEAVDQHTRDAIETAGADVAWDDGALDTDTDADKPRRGRLPRLA